MRLKLLGKFWTISFPKWLGWTVIDGHRRQVEGDCTDPSETHRQIRILNRLRGEDALCALLHEMLHAADWSKDESWVEAVSEDIARAIMRPEIRSRIFE